MAHRCGWQCRGSMGSNRSSRSYVLVSPTRARRVCGRRCRRPNMASGPTSIPKCRIRAGARQPRKSSVLANGGPRSFSTAMATTSRASTKVWKTNVSGREGPARAQASVGLQLFFAGLDFSKLGAPVCPLEHESIGCKCQQADADHHQTERDRTAEENQVVAVVHDQ